MNADPPGLKPRLLEPLPGEAALIVAGARARQTHGLNPWIIFAVAATAAFAGTGDKGGFRIGDKGGYRLAKRYGRKVRLDDVAISRSGATSSTAAYQRRLLRPLRLDLAHLQQLAPRTGRGDRGDQADEVPIKGS